MVKIPTAMSFEIIKNMPDMTSGKRSVVLIDDTPGWVEKWGRPFQISGVETVEIEGENVKSLLPALVAKIRPDQMSSIALVITDQFRDDYRLMDQARRFVYTLRNQNQQAWIIETSFPNAGWALGGHASLGKDDLNEALELAAKQPPILERRLNALKFFCNDYFLEAQRMDLVNDQRLPDDQLSLSFSIGKAYKARWNSHFLELIDLVGIDTKTFDKTYHSLSSKDKILLLHLVYNGLGHLSANSPQEIYIDSIVQRMRKQMGINTTA